MTEQAIITAALVGVLALLLGALAGHLILRRKDPTTDNSASDTARHEERVKALNAQVTKLEGENQAHIEAIETHVSTEITLRADLAAEKANVNGLDKALAREKEVAEKETARLTAELADAKAQVTSLAQRATEQGNQLAAFTQLESELRGQLDRAGGHITDRDRKLAEKEAALADANAKLSNHSSELAAAKEREANLTKDVSARDELLKNLQAQFVKEFENIAGKVLEATSEKLSTQSNEALTGILEPLRERIGDFQKRIEATHTEDTKQRTALHEQIEHIVRANQSLGQQAEGLANALKGDSRLRGRWGEVRLERILESSGLIRNKEFVVQGEGLGIKGEDGGSQRPDVVILLPENRHFIIDSKVSLVPYLEYEAANDEEEKSACLKNVLVSVKGHIDGLASKKYQHAEAINSHDLVFMFVPIEGVASLLLQHDDSLYDYAWKKKIVLVSPSTLFMVMQTVSSIWRYERQSENALQIANQAGLLYDKLVGAVESFNQVASHLASASDAHSEAMKRLGSGKGNALQRAEKLKSLGASSKKSLPSILISGEKVAIETEDEDEISPEPLAIPASAS